MATPQLVTPTNASRDSSYVNRIVEVLGGGEADEAALLNGLAVLGFDVAFLQGLSDRDPNRRFANDAAVRALRAGISRSDLEKAARIGKAMGEIGGTYASKELGLSGEQSANYDRIRTQHAFAFKGEAPTANAPVERSGVVRGPSTRIAGPAPPATPSTATPTVAGRARTARARGTLAGPGTGTTPAPGPAAPALPPNASDAEVERYIRKNYGFSAWALDIPEIRQALVDIARDLQGAPVDELTIEGRLSATEWWKTHEATQREKIEERGEDPATYNSGVEGEFKKISYLMGQLGFSLPEGRLREIARQSYEFGWEDVERRAALASEFDYNPDTGAQGTSRIVGDLRGLASDYLVPLSEQTIDQWGRQIIAGTARTEDFTNYAKNVAKGMFAHYADDLDAGRTVRQLADPFVQMAAKDLELNPDQIDLMDPKWRKALELDPKTGMPMQPSSWQRLIRSDSAYGWDYTNNARTEAAEFSRKLLETFGAVG
jgi:hypothetical protein